LTFSRQLFIILRTSRTTYELQDTNGNVVEKGDVPTVVNHTLPSFDAVQATGAQ
jgi:hypothetical protein